MLKNWPAGALAVLVAVAACGGSNDKGSGTTGAGGGSAGVSGGGKGGVTGTGATGTGIGGYPTGLGTGALCTFSTQCQSGNCSSGACAAATTGSGGYGSGVGGNSSGTGGSYSSVGACVGLPFTQGTAGSSGSGGSTSCTGVSSEAEALPVDMYIMMDRSVSMTTIPPGGTLSRWDGVKAAIQQFVNDPRATGIGAGIQYFPASTDPQDTVTNCNASNYATPAVEIGLLPGNAMALTQSIQATQPAGFTPTYAALDGALQHAKAWATAHPSRTTVVVFVTDGYPTQCNLDYGAIDRLARDAWENAPRIRTYVVGIGGVQNLNQVAQAGGTRTSFLIDQGDVAGPLVTALLNITTTPLACQFQIPPPPAMMAIDPTKVQVIYTPMTGSAEEVPRVDSVGSCATAPNGGWYFDNPTTPSYIIVCPCTCNRFGAGIVDIRLGCEPQTYVG
ncbi:MAG TPA: vWA domain-containing protein [Polyangiaceae bacterium]